MDAWLSTVHPEDRERVAALWKRIEETGEAYVLEYRLLTPDGNTRWVRDQGATLSRDAVGRPREVQGIVIDLTHTRRSEHQVGRIRSVEDEPEVPDGIEDGADAF